MKKKLQIFLDQLNDLIEKYGEEAPITLGQMRDIIQENIFRKELKADCESLFVTEKDVQFASVRLSRDKFDEWFKEHYPITVLVRDPTVMVVPDSTTVLVSEIPKQFVEGFSGIY